MRKTLWFLSTVSFTILLSCNSLEDVKNDKVRGMERTYVTSKEKAMKVAMEVLEKLGAGVVEVDVPGGYLGAELGRSTAPQARSTMSFGSGGSHHGRFHMNSSSSNAGSIVGVWVDPDGKNMRVTVHAKKRYKIDLANRFSEEDFHWHFERMIKLEPPT